MNFTTLITTLGIWGNGSFAKTIRNIFFSLYMWYIAWFFLVLAWVRWPVGTTIVVAFWLIGLPLVEKAWMRHNRLQQLAAQDAEFDRILAGSNKINLD